MPDLQLPQIILIVFISALTAVAAVTDLRTRRIPNLLTVPAFGLGLVYQLVFHPYADTIVGSLMNAGSAFALGFGALFVLWLIGGGGGGDAKLMGAISVWMGWRMTVAVLILSTVFVLAGTFAVVVYNGLARGFAKTKQRFTASESSRRIGFETMKDKQNRRIMTYAFPVALATWVVLFWFHFKPQG